MANQTSLSLLLKRYRMAAGLSQEALAQRADLSARAISDLERGLRRAPHTATLELLATALALSSHQRALLLAAARPQYAADVLSFGMAESNYRPQGLPAPPNGLIGRERECGRAIAMLRSGAVRLVTVTGSSGVGKTRLALEIGHNIASMFREGAVFVDLAPLTSASLVPSAIAQALQLHEQGSAPLDQQIRVHLHDKHILLLLDNFEHVIGSALFVADLLAWCPHVSLLVTSRTPLRLRGERTLPLASLSLEDAIVLFRERAHAMRPGTPFAVSEAAAICERVDCLPLAIELAASQMTMLSLTQILGNVDQRMALALEGAKDLPARQRTMEAAIGWSYELLTPGQQRCFRVLGVFVGGMTLDAVRIVGWEGEAATETEALLTLAALVDASLAQAEIMSNGSTRFHLLELVREYAMERLCAEGEEASCRFRHAAYYAQLAESMLFSARDPGDALAHLAIELPNARAALEWANHQRDAALGLRLTGFARLWDIRGVGREAELWLERMLALDAEARAVGALTVPLLLRVERLYGYARVLLNHGNVEKAEMVAQDSVLLAQQVGNQGALSEAYMTLGLIAQAKGDVEQATNAFSESAAHADPAAPSESRYHALFCLADLARSQGDIDRAHVLFESALEGAEAADNTWDRTIIITLLAHLERQQHDNARARRRYLECLAHFHAFSSPTFFAWCLEGYSALLCAEERYAQATRLCAAAATLRLQARAPLPAAERGPFELTLANARAALGPVEFETEWAAGSALTESAALAEARKSR